MTRRETELRREGDVDVTEPQEAVPEEGAPAEGAVSEPETQDFRPAQLRRVLGAALLISAAAGAMAGGVFGSIAARTLAAGAAVCGVGLAWLTLRSRRRAIVLQVLVLPVAVLLGALALIPGEGDPSRLTTLVREAVSAGRLLRPPAPFDPGWRPILVVLFVMLGFAAAWVGTALRRPKMGFVLPLPVLALTAISQPAEAEFVAGIIAFLPLLGGLALLFGGDRDGVTELSAAFEVKRAVRGGILTVLAIGGLFVLNSSNVLFPEPVYDPTEQARKPDPVPLGEVRDRILFEVDGPVTGPWRTGVLDVYDGSAWRIPPFDAARFRDIPPDGIVDDSRTGDVSVTFTIRDMGNTAKLPGVAGVTRVEGLESSSDAEFVFDPRSQLFRVPTGRVPQELAYTLSLPSYPGADELRSASPSSGLAEYLTDMPPPPQEIRELLDEAPANAWERLDFLRGRLSEVAVATGAGVPRDVPPEKVVDILFGSHEASPFEIVASEAMLARWAGIPSRIGFGFDGVLEEDGRSVVRPKLAANWLEVSFEGIGWVPIIGAPEQAKASLDTNPEARFDPTIEPSEDVAVEVYIPVELENFELLFERIRRRVLQALPFVLALLATYLSLPAARRAIRRRKRRRWAEERDPRSRIAVAYTEFRDLATDLNVGDPYETPLEYLDRVVEDREHEELAWLVSRALYGDLADTATEEDARAAWEMSASLRRRMFRAQPWQTRVLGVLSRASLKEPYTLEVPTVWQLRMRGRGRGRDVRRRGGLRRLVGAGK